MDMNEKFYCKKFKKFSEHNAKNSPENSFAVTEKSQKKKRNDFTQS